MAKITKDEQTQATAPTEREPAGAAQQVQEAAPEIQQSDREIFDAHPFITETIAYIWDYLTIDQCEKINTDNPEAFKPVFIEIVREAAQIGRKEEGEPPENLRSPDFDFDAFRNAFDADGGFPAAAECFKAFVRVQSADLTDHYLATTFATLTSEEKQRLSDAAKSLTAFLQSNYYKEIKAVTEKINKYINDHKAEFEAATAATAAFASLSDDAKGIHDLVPYLQMELDEAQDDPAIAGKTIKHILRDGFTPTGRVKKSPYKELIERAKKRREEATAGAQLIERTEQAAEQLQHIIAKPVKETDYPLDKPNSVIWQLLADPKTTTDGQLRLTIDTSKRGSKQQALVLYGIDFEALQDISISKQLTQFDKRVYIAAGALHKAGNEIFTETQIYSAMGNSGMPGKGDLKKIDDSLTKMLKAVILVDNAHEVANTKGKGYTGFRYDGVLLPFERVRAIVNGKVTDGAIRLFREPPLISFARERKQITTIPRMLLQSPVSKTDANLRIEDYLIERIGHMKNGYAHHKMRYETIFEKCGITTAKQKQRAPGKIKRYLEHYKMCGWIKDYKEEKDGIRISF